jgi:hypothetical protein
MGKTIEEVPEDVLLKKLLQAFEESRTKLNLTSEEEYSFSDFCSSFDESEKLTKKLFDLIVRESYGRHKQSIDGTGRNPQTSTILFTSSPLTAMLHLVSQASNQGQLTIPRRRVSEQQPGNVLAQLVNSLRDPRDEMDEEDIF